MELDAFMSYFLSNTSMSTNNFIKDELCTLNKQKNTLKVSSKSFSITYLIQVTEAYLENLTN